MLISTLLGNMWSALYALFLLVLADARDSPMVTTNYGTIRGKWMSSARNLSVAAFLGIPYAEPPIGELRFQSPRPWTQNWTDVRDATEDGPVCTQMDRQLNIWGTEDCLHLNIFVPVIMVDPKLPVLVFVHGGGFSIGSNNSTQLAPDYLMDQEIIVVTVNYRLGIFGFLSTTTEVVPGNAGIKDVREALNWIQRNIETFGGDPNMVTLSGQSAGAAVVHLLGLSNSTEGLFNSYITQSGSALAQWAMQPPYFVRLKYLTAAKSLGCTSNIHVDNFGQILSDYIFNDTQMTGYDNAVEEDKEIVRCMRRASPARLVQTITLFHIWRYDPTCSFTPTVELKSVDPIITDHPLRMIKRREFRDIPWITGVVMDEGLLKVADLLRNQRVLDEFNENFDKFVIFFLELQEFVSNSTAFVEAVIKFYFPPDSADDQDSFIRDRKLTEAKDNLIKMATDGLVNWSSYRALNYQAEMMNSSVYFYLFAYEGTFSSTYANGIPRRHGVSHSDDLNYLFPCLNNQFADLQLHNTESDWTMINVMTEMWSNFVKNGDPSARLTMDWQPYQEVGAYMRFGSGRSPEMSMERDFLPMRMGFWEFLMAETSYPLDKLFPIDLDDDYYNESEEEGQIPNAAMTPGHFLYIQNIFVLLLAYAVVWE